MTVPDRTPSSIIRRLAKFYHKSPPQVKFHLLLRKCSDFVRTPDTHSHRHTRGGGYPGAGSLPLTRTEQLLLALARLMSFPHSPRVVPLKITHPRPPTVIPAPSSSSPRRRGPRLGPRASLPAHPRSRQGPPPFSSPMAPVATGMANYYENSLQHPLFVIPAKAGTQTGTAGVPARASSLPPRAAAIFISHGAGRNRHGQLL